MKKYIISIAILGLTNFLLADNYCNEAKNLSNNWYVQEKDKIQLDERMYYNLVELNSELNNRL